MAEKRPGDSRSQTVESFALAVMKKSEAGPVDWGEAVCVSFTGPVMMIPR